VVANFDTNSSTDVAIHFTSDWQDITGTLRAFGIRNTNSECWRFRDIFTGYTPVDPNSSSPGTLTGAELWRPYGIPSGLYVGNIPPMTVYYFKVERCN
jgi:hypothetical protein